MTQIEAMRLGMCRKCIFAAICLPDPRMSKIKAIKMRREATGESLLEAKKYVEKNMNCGVLSVH